MFVNQSEQIIWKGSGPMRVDHSGEEVDLTQYTPVCLARTSDNTTFDGKKARVYGGKFTKQQSGALSLVQILEILCSHWLNYAIIKVVHAQKESIKGALMP